MAFCVAWVISKSSIRKVPYDVDLVRASHLYKVFGKNERQVIERLKAGESREELASLGTAAVIDVSFEVAKGETFVVMGLSGSGKSTLIRMINGLWSPSEGTVEVAGKVVSLSLIHI